VRAEVGVQGSGQGVAKDLSLTSPRRTCGCQDLTTQF
jgi:hypothetical protein